MGSSMRWSANSPHSGRRSTGLSKPTTFPCGRAGCATGARTATSARPGRPPQPRRPERAPPDRLFADVSHPADTLAACTPRRRIPAAVPPATRRPLTMMRREPAWFSAVLERARPSSSPGKPRDCSSTARIPNALSCSPPTAVASARWRAASAVTWSAQPPAPGSPQSMRSPPGSCNDIRRREAGHSRHRC